MEKSTNTIGQCRIVHIFREAQIILKKEKCSSGPEQSTPITIVLSQEIHVEVPAYLITDVGDIIFQSLERVPVFRQPHLPPSPLSLCNIRVVPRDLGPSPHTFRFQWRVTIQDTAETRIVVTSVFRSEDDEEVSRALLYRSDSARSCLRQSMSTAFTFL